MSPSWSVYLWHTSNPLINDQFILLTHTFKPLTHRNSVSSSSCGSWSSSTFMQMCRWAGFSWPRCRQTSLLSVWNGGNRMVHSKHAVMVGCQVVTTSCWGCYTNRCALSVHMQHLSGRHFLTTPLENSVTNTAVALSSFLLTSPVLFQA